MRKCKGCFSRSLLRKAGKKGRRRAKRCSRCQEGEYSATLSVQSGSADPCACYAYTFIQWDERLSNNATQVTALYEWTGGGQLERSESASEPYSNTYPITGAATLTAPAGTNWIWTGGGSAFDFNLGRCAPDCSGTIEAINNFVRNPRVRVSCE